MENPWQSLPTQAPYVYEADQPAIAAFNAKVGEHHRIPTDLLPEPFLGSKDAPIVLLSLNPGFHELDYLTYQDPYALDAWKKNVRHEPQPYPFYLIDPQLAHVAGASWWRKKLKEPLLIAGPEEVANKFFCVEFFPYHSRKFKYMGSLLESQQHSFTLVNQAMDRNAVIILMRSQREWEYAVPRLTSYPMLFTLRNKQNAVISRNNCVEGFPVIEAILRNRSPYDQELVVSPNQLGA
jgi:hypothetical protein